MAAVLLFWDTNMADVASSKNDERTCNTILTFCRSTVPSSPASLKRYYFEHLQLNSTQLKFSVSSASRLPEDLQSLKSSVGLILVNLEDASIDLGTSQTNTFT